MLPSLALAATALIPFLSLLDSANALVIDRTPLAPTADIEARQASADNDLALQPSVDATMGINTGAVPMMIPYQQIEGYWNPVNITSDPSTTTGEINNTANAAPITITVLHTGRPIPTNQMFVGMIATLNLFYTKQLPPQQSMSTAGVDISFTAGLKHKITLQPLNGAAVSWQLTDDTVKQLGVLIFNKNLNTEIAFRAYTGGRGYLDGFVTNPNDDTQNANTTAATS